MDDAVCREVGGEMFFPENGEDSHQARAVCRACPVQSECLNYALTLEDSGVWFVTGIWGGTGQKDRMRLRRRNVA
jgi:WhiB family redox-sensing transcriptional regulator